MHRIAIVLLAMNPLPAFAGENLPPEPPNQPDWSFALKQARWAATKDLDQPEAARIEWIQGFQWGSMKSVIGERSYGWVACGKLSTQKPSGEYKKPRDFSVMVEPSGETKFGYAGKVHSSCYLRSYVPPNIEMHSPTP